MSIMAILRDITEKNKLEKDFQMLFESMVEGFALHEMIYDESGHAIDYRFISVNPAFSQMTGLDPVEIVGKTVHEVLPEIDDAWVQTYEKVVQSGEPARFSKRSENLDRYYDVVAYRTSPGQFATIIRDVSEQKRAEAQMQESEERFRAISEYSHNAICIVNEAGKIIWANENLVDLSGFSREQLLNAESFGQFIAPESMRFVVDNFLKAMRGETYEHHYQFIFLRADGEKRTAEKYMMDIRDRHGHRYLVISILDITDRIRYEEEKRKMQEELTQAQKMESIGRLAGGVAHDFNNMLAIILGYAEMMIGELTEDHPFHEGMQQILEAGRRSRDLTRQLLAFARKQTLEMRRLNINSVIGGFEKMLRRTLRENIRIELSLDPYPCLFHGDVGQIEQVLLNLAVNAQDAMPNGGTLLIETGKTLLEESDAIIQDGGNAGWYLALSITDTGIGMDDETVKRVFDPFFTTKELGRGTGLGLSTVYGIVRQHDGHVSVTSEPGQGTTFRVFLPCVMNGEGESSVTEETAHINTGTETILLAEDQDHVRALAIRLLERKAPDGITARATADATVDPIHLLITDVVMPDMNGRALYESLQVKRPNMRVLYMSGYPADIIGTHGVLEEGVHYIQKPFDISQFLHKVREILDEG
jgi:PAS domain S-box-containing protein